MNSNVAASAKHNLDFGRKMHTVHPTQQYVRSIRYALSGAIVGVAVTGLLARYFGYDDGTFRDLWGASAGFVAVLAYKLFHMT